MNPSAIPIANPYSGGGSYVPYGTSANNAISSAQAALNTPTIQPVPQASPHNGNWFTHLLPTIGSITAPLIAGALAPETGGLSLLAELALAGGGSAAGKAAQNAVEGTPVNAEDLIKSGAEGVAGQALGSGVSAIGGKAIGKGVDILGSKVEGRAAQAASEAASKSAADEAARIGTEFSAVKPGQAKVGQAIENLKALGIEQPTAQDMVNIGNTYTGSNPETGTGVLNFYKQQALDQAGGNVNLDNTMSNLHNTLASAENRRALGSTEPQTTGRGLPKAPNNISTQIVQQVRDMLPEGTLDTNGKITTQLSPQEGLSLLKNVGKQVEATTPKANSLGVLDPADVAENNVWKSVYNDIKSSVYNRPEVDSTIAGLRVRPDQSAVIDEAIRANGITDPTVAANIKNNLTSVLNNSQTAQDLLNAERPMVNVAKTGNIATADQLNNPQLPRNVRAGKAAATVAPSPATGGDLKGVMALGGLVGAPMTGGASLVAALPEAAKLATKPELQDAVYKLTQAGVSKKVANAIPDVLTGASQFITHAPDSQPSAVNLNLGSNNMNPNPQPGVDPNSLNSLLLQLAVAESANPTTSSAGGNMLNSLVPQVQNSNVAQQSLTGAENAFQQAGGGQGGIVGNLAKILGTVTGNPAGQYEQQRNQLIHQLTPLGIPTSAVPDITGNNLSAANQFQTLQDMIRARLQGGSVLNSLPIQ